MPAIASANSSVSAKPRNYLWLNIACVFGVLLGMALVPKGDKLAVVLPPNAPASAAMDLAMQTNSALVSTNSSGRVAILQSAEPGLVFALYKAGALIVLDAALVSACLNWSK